MSKIQITPKYSEVKPQGFYVYIHRRATDGKTSSSGGFSWWFYGDDPKEYTHPSKGMIDMTSKPVLCSNGILFASGSEAARWLMENGWPQASDGRISSAARGVRKTAYGFSWKHVKMIANGY